MVAPGTIEIGDNISQCVIADKADVLSLIGLVQLKIKDMEGVKSGDAMSERFSLGSVEGTQLLQDSVLLSCGGAMKSKRLHYSRQ